MHGGLYEMMKQDRNSAEMKLNKKHLGFMWKYISKYKSGVSISFFIVIALTILELYNPFIVKNIIDISIPNRDISGMFIQGGVLALVSLLIWTFNYFQVYINGRISQSIVFDLRNDLMKKVVNQKMDFFSEKETGEIITVLSNDIKAVSDAFSSDMLNLIKDLFVLFSIIFIMFSLNYKLATIVVLSIPILFISIKFLGKEIRSGYKKVKEKISELNVSIEENMSGIREIKALSVEKKKNDEFIEINQGALRANLKLVILVAMFFPIIVLVSSLVVGMILWVGGYEFSKGLLTIGMISIFLNYSRKFFMPIKNLSQVFNIYQSAVVSLFRIYDYFQYEDRVYGDIQVEEYHIKVDGLKFAYDETEVLDVESLEVSFGESIGIVGDSGSGKSTLARLMSGLYDYNNGSITVGKYQVSDLEPKKLTEIVTYVNQSTKLFRGTVFDNISYGRESASKEEVENILDDMGIRDRLKEFKNGLDTKVQENQIGVSGGQKQIVSLLRSVLAKNNIIIFDEITSSLDLELEKKVSEYFKRRKDKTLIFITHRISGILGCDRIIFMKDGKIIDSGSHKELLSKSSDYLEYCRYQGIEV
ncbi:MAG: ABC transporter ATP-binding protein/permease [Firmicutes bacterium]|jgi:ABC-type multidrug transport system fused ATPase/permease subunit|nr:ABC transporter ATP-binding protein/permease [Bacillota bacterium]